MNRYFYYLVFINSITNIIVFAPEMLLQDRYKGALASIVLAMPFFTLLLYLFNKAMYVFPGQPLPEILKTVMPPWVQKTIMLVSFPVWYVSGSMMLLVVSDIIQLVINPEMPVILNIGFLSFVVLFVVRYSSKTVLYGLEVFFWFIVPLMTFIFLKAMTDSKFSWHALMDAGGHFASTPTLFAFAAAGYSFAGFTDMFSFHQDFQGSYAARHLWLIPVFNFIAVIMAFSIPIGMLGIEAVGDYKYPFISASDSLSLKMGIIERVYFIFLILYILISIINIIVHWKVSYDLFRDMLRHQFQIQRLTKSTRVCLAVFFLFPFIIYWIFNDYQLIMFVKYWLLLLVLFELFWVGTVMYAAAVFKRREAPAQ